MRQALFTLLSNGMTDRRIAVGAALRRSWRLLLAALALSGLLAWVAGGILVARGIDESEEVVARHAAHLADGNLKSMILGSMLTIGGLNSVVRATAQGTLPPNNPQITRLLGQIHKAFDLGNIRVLDRNGMLVAYYTQAGASPTGRDVSFRPYFRTAVKGIPNMYAALGSTSGERGFYIAAPVFGSDVVMSLPGLARGTGAPDVATDDPSPTIVGVVVAKVDFEEVDRLLDQESLPLAVVSPEGVVFASNVPAWRFRVMGAQKDLEAAKQDSRTSKAYAKEPPRLMDMDAEGRLLEGGRALTMVSAPVDWKDPQGSWRLVGFVDPASSFGVLERLAVGATGFVFVLLFGVWRQARRNVGVRTAELEAANRQLAALSITDGLTGLANRRHFDEVLAEETMRAKRGGHPLALMMIDVDHFKQFNDRYGHMEGDDCLKAVARALRAHAKRAGDLVARYGGEEFALLLPDADTAALLQYADAIRGSIESLAIPHEVAPAGRITVSIGVAVVDSDTAPGAAPILQSADKALYCAKNSGRNRVVLAREDVPL